MSTIRFDDDLGGMIYPFLPAEWQWKIVTYPLRSLAELDKIQQADDPTLRWVKDDKLLDLHVKGMDSDTFFAETGLRPFLHNGGYLFSKRLSRVLRPFRFYLFAQANEITVDYSDQLNGRLWDGCGLMSRSFLERVAEQPYLSEQHRSELLHTSRFELTMLHNKGQDKGHLLVVDELSCDFLLPINSTKSELLLVDSVFVGLQPVHHKDGMRLDIQSLINLYPFFTPNHLLAWMQMEGAFFLDGIRNGRLDALFSRLHHLRSADDVTRLQRWHIAEYLASGGQALWFAGIVNGIGRQHQKRVKSGKGKVRYPIPGGRYYIFPADVGLRNVPSGCITLDPKTATAWVNDQDWLDFIVPVLGGCDGDDALWVFPFLDKADNRRKILVWRSPNQLGEYLLLHPTTESHEIQWPISNNGVISYPLLDSRDLPPRIDALGYKYGRLQANETVVFTKTTPYTVAAMWPAVQRAVINCGTLGAFCNSLMVTKALYGRLPKQLPATLEDVIDGSVKTGLDLTPVKEWSQHAATAIVEQGKSIPTALLNRLTPLLTSKSHRQLKISESHWLDSLDSLTQMHLAHYAIDLALLAADANPPLQMYRFGYPYLKEGGQLRSIYSTVIRTALMRGELSEGDFVLAYQRSRQFLQQYQLPEQTKILLGVATHLYASGRADDTAVRDGVLWQLTGTNDDFSFSIVQLFFKGLREIGLLGEPRWTEDGAICWYQNGEKCPLYLPLTLKAVWFNWLKVQESNRFVSMSDVPEEKRYWAKQQIQQLLQSSFLGMRLKPTVTSENRVIMITDHGNIFGWVQSGQELSALRRVYWQLAWGMARDGNVHALLLPTES